ncbi:hypothetical protein [Azospirillum sp. TSO22-1]|uniref:hypothetical protein n=1 Tax=Azospirillum sp. TSO22-1 TaxID=716789 RepID=UPI000D60BA0E|nr:hypothetical protein [Azospirillum sp. TSO22-1]PWC42077.1 hypothetical protein TSO221_22545 [Azospirillum sp. TSO22-1]
MDASEAVAGLPPAPGFPATRDDFPHSLQAYAVPDGDAAEAGGWSLSLYRAVGPEERAWLQAHGFTLTGRLWIRPAAGNTAENG